LVPGGGAVRSRRDLAAVLPTSQSFPEIKKIIRNKQIFILKNNLAYCRASSPVLFFVLQ
jgi:hypothetical protein